MIITRFAPSPTGPLHVGGARTALFNWLLARGSKDGKFILRIEDTDQKRCSQIDVYRIQQGLNWLGLNYDEMYTQSERLDIYKEYVNQLLDKKLAYRVFENKAVSKEELAQMKWAERSRAMKINHWREAGPIHIQKMLEQDAPYHVRLKMPRQTKIIAEDYLRGTISFPTKKLHDPVIQKSDGWPTYHLASVVDDHLMKITHVLRGEEWISSLPIHIALYEAFGWKPPTFVHLPVILNPIGSGKLSKRKTKSQEGKDVPVLVSEYITLGFLPEALINYMSLLGWSPGDDRELFSKQSLIHTFSLDGLGRSSSRWDVKRLKFINRLHIKKLADEEFTNLCFLNIKPDLIDEYQERILRILKAARPMLEDRIDLLADSHEWTSWLYQPWSYKPKFDPNFLLTKDLTFEKVYEIFEYIISFDAKDWEEALRLLAEEEKIKPGIVFWPIRVAVSGKKVTLPLFESIELLGGWAAKNRIKDAMKTVGNIIGKDTTKAIKENYSV